MSIAVGIVGLGQIAQGYDRPDGPVVTTHIKACLQDPRLNIAWIADADVSHAQEVREHWNLTADILSPQDVVRQSPDILCIATPDNTHADFVRAVLPKSPKIILCEKPLARSFADAAELMTLCKERETRLVVNYVRRWIPGLAEWLHAARDGAYGAPIGATGVYCRGLAHSACHALDLIGAVFGADDVRVEGIDDAIPDYDAADTTVTLDMSVRTGSSRAPVHLQGVDGRIAFRWELEMAFELSRLRVWNEDGIRMQVHAGGSRSELTPVSEFHDKPARHMAFVWKNLADHLETGKPLLGRAEDLIDGFRLLDAAAKAR